MHLDNLLNQVTVATPCTVSWDGMPGDDRVRFCGLCRKHVYNFAAMTKDEALALIREKNGQLCGRLYRRPDGTLVTADCRAAIARHYGKPKPLQFTLRAIMAVVAGFAAIFGLVKHIGWNANAISTTSAQQYEIMGLIRALPTVPSLENDGQASDDPSPSIEQPGE